MHGNEGRSGHGRQTRPSEGRPGLSASNDTLLHLIRHGRKDRLEYGTDSCHHLRNSLQVARAPSQTRAIARGTHGRRHARLQYTRISVTCLDSTHPPPLTSLTVPHRTYAVTSSACVHSPHPSRRLSRPRGRTLPRTGSRSRCDWPHRWKLPPRRADPPAHQR